MNTIERIKGAGRGLVLGTVVGGVAGLGLVSILDSDPSKTPAEARAELNDAKQGLMDAENSLNATIRGIGEVCMVALEPYRTDGELGKETEDTAISDIFADPEQPCGPSKSKIRFSVAGLRDADFNLADAGATVNRAEYFVETARDIDLQVFVALVGIGAVMGTVVGELSSRTE